MHVPVLSLNANSCITPKLTPASLTEAPLERQTLGLEEVQGNDIV